MVCTLEIASSGLQQHIARSCQRIIQAKSGAQTAPEVTSVDLGMVAVIRQKNLCLTVFSSMTNTV